jgi:hypothetical protein
MTANVCAFILVLLECTLSIALERLLPIISYEGKKLENYRNSVPQAV